MTHLTESFPDVASRLAHIDYHHRMTVLDYDDLTLELTTFVRECDRSLEDAPRLRVAPNLANVLTFLHDELQRLRPSAKVTKDRESPLSRLILSLGFAFDDNNAILALLERQHPAEVSALRAEVAKAAIDAATMVRLLGAIRTTLEDPFPLVDNNLLASDHSSAVALLIARAGLLYEDPKDLKAWIRHRLSEGVTNILLHHFGDDLRADVNLAAAVNAGFAEVIGRLVTVDLSQRFLRYDESTLHYGLVRNATIFAARRDDTASAAREVAESLHESLVRRVLYSAFLPVFSEHDHAVRSGWNAVAKLGHKFADWFHARGWTIQREHHPGFAGVFRDSSRTFLVNLLADFVAKQIVARALTLAEVQMVLDEAPGRDDDQLQWYFANISVQEKLLAWRRNTGTYTSEVVAEVLASLAAAPLMATPESWDAWIEHTTREGAKSESAWEYLRWSVLDDDQRRHALSPLSAGFAASRTYDVVIPVSGADVKGAWWRSGTITWYTPATHSLGERLSFGGTPGKLHVHQQLNASTPASAYRRALVVLEPALSALSFALSASDRWGGFRPVLENWYLYGDPERIAWGSSGFTDRTSAPDRQVSQERLEQFANVYAPIIDRLATRAPRSELEERLLRALVWYRSGRWQPDHVRRFLDHFVALEHLFSAGIKRKGETVAAGVSRVWGSWSFRGFPFSAQLERTIDASRILLKLATDDAAIAAAVDEVVRTNASNCRNAAYWRTSLSPWLTPIFVATVLERVDGAVVDRASWESHIAALEKLRQEESDWLYDDDQRAFSAWFGVLCLARRRNAIVHEAMTYLPGIELEADALTHIVENVLMHLVDDALNGPGAARSIDEIFANLTPPWASALV